MTACDTLVCIRGTCLVKRHRINAEMWAKLDKIKHTGECTDAGQCSKCAALFMFSNMGSLMRVWCLFFWSWKAWKSVWPVHESVDKALHFVVKVELKANQVHHHSNLKEFWSKSLKSFAFITASCLFVFACPTVLTLTSHFFWNPNVT